jgi:lysophospholipase L1-like esterase
MVPKELTERSLQLGTYPTASQFGTTLFDTDADVVILSILGETATALYRHKEEGYLFYPANLETWIPEDRHWLRSNFERADLLEVSQSMENFANIIARIRSRRDVPILVYNTSSVIPGEAVHNYQGLDETYATRCKRFNLALTSLSKEIGISIVDVDTIIARSGADRLKIDAMHLTADGYRLVAEEVVRVLTDLGTVPAPEDESCARA